jgi:hypothetical protein
MSSFLSKQTASLACVALLAGCGGRALDGGQPIDADTQHIDDGDDVVDAGDTGNADDAGDDTAPFPIGPEVYTAADVAAAKKTCDEPHGSVETYGSTVDATTLISGAWYACPSPDDGGVDPVVGAGMQFADDGKFYTLQLDSHGGLVATAGLAETGTWQVQQEGGGTGFSYPMSLLESGADGSTGDSALYFEQSPARWDYGGAFDQWFVRFSP